MAASFWESGSGELEPDSPPEKSGSPRKSGSSPSGVDVCVCKVKVCEWGVFVSVCAYGEGVCVCMCRMRVGKTK